jgi:hypothetical protein
MLASGTIEGSNYPAFGKVIITGRLRYSCIFYTKFLSTDNLDP